MSKRSSKNKGSLPSYLSRDDRLMISDDGGRHPNVPRGKQGKQEHKRDGSANITQTINYWYCCCIIGCIIITLWKFTRHPVSLRPPPKMKSMKRKTTINNQFAIDYINITMRHIDKSDPNQRFTKIRAVDNIIPFVITEQGKLLCKDHIKEMLDMYGNDDMAGGYKRLKTFVEMINVGLSLQIANESTTSISDLPLLMMTGDIHGCDVPTEREAFSLGVTNRNGSDELLDLNINYPRLSWAIPAPKYNQDAWCHAIGVPGYQMWLDYKDETHSSWKRTFSKQAKQYPWSKKKNKAVWRGSTTSHSSYPSNKLSDIPRGQLIETSISHPHLIDAAFKSFDEVWRDRKEELMKTTIVKEEMKFDDFMDYKAIIDIDGNNWRYVLCVHMIFHTYHTQSTNHLVFSISSSRFPKLLCTNSVVIKVS